MPKTRKTVVKKSATSPRSRQARAKPLAVGEPKLSQPVTRRVAPVAQAVAPKAADTMFDLMLAFSPVNLLLRQQAAFASMLSAMGSSTSKPSRRKPH